MSQSVAAAKGGDALRVGRYAPSPTGPLHFGSLAAALASFLQARHHGGRWLMRIEDLDPPREVPGAADDILRTLEAYGLHWDGPVLYQSSRTAAYETALETLRGQGLAFDCGCVRREAQSGPKGLEGPIYPGTCREGLPAGRSARSVRALAPDCEFAFDDAVQGHYVQHLARDIGDFVIRRADGLFAYQCAVVVDDAFQGADEIVRGTDLLSSTPRQICLQRALGLPTPRYAHVPLLVDDSGRKLSKSTGAIALRPQQPEDTLLAALEVLGQEPPARGTFAHRDDILAWATANWRLDRVPPVRELTCPSIKRLAYS